MTQKPKRVTIPKTPNQPSSVEFELPQIELSLDFFIKKGQAELTSTQLISEVFGEDGFRLTEAEQVYCLVKALESLEIVMPFEIKDSKDRPIPVAVEIAKVMKPSGSSFESFEVVAEGGVFEFSRPQQLDNSVIDGGLGGVGLFMLQWLSGHNLGEDFSFTNIKLPMLLALARGFAAHMLQVSFPIATKDADGVEFKAEIPVTLDDLVTFINEM